MLIEVVVAGVDKTWAETENTCFVARCARNNVCLHVGDIEMTINVGLEFGYCRIGRSLVRCMGMGFFQGSFLSLG